MKKIIVLIVLFLITIIGCTKTEIEIFELEGKRDALLFEVEEIENNIESLKEEQKYLEDNLEYFRDVNNITQHIIRIQIKQSHFTLDLTQHAKDEFNAIELELPVSKQYYDNIEIGDIIDDSFRMGSFVFRSSIGKWKISVIDKFTL